MPADAIERERAFHDAEYGKGEHADKLPSSRAAFAERFAAITEFPYWYNGVSYYSDARGLSLRLAVPPGGWPAARVLDVGCGLGELALGLGLDGARVDAFDLSAVGVERARSAAARYGLSDRVTFRAANAESLPYDSAAFDVALGWGVLHHLVKYPKAAAELARVVKRGGLLVWQETWGENPILNAGRRRYTLVAEDAGDVFVTYPILRAWCRDHFMIKHVRHLSLLYMLKRFTHPDRRIPARLLPLERGILAALQAGDALLTRIPGLRRLGAEAVIVLRRH